MQKNRVLFLIICISIVYACEGQNISGQWKGKLETQGPTLRLSFNISQSDSGNYEGIIRSIDQKASDTLTSVSFENDTLTIVHKKWNIHYIAHLEGDTLFKGVFMQNGGIYPLNLSQTVFAKVQRPQLPQKPYPYYEEQVTIENTKDNLQLKGTLTLPAKKGKFPAVILLTGSGMQDRDETAMGHKPFLVLADYLTRNGVAVLRCDDRGMPGGLSAHYYLNADYENLLNDAQSAVDFLRKRKQIDKKRIGLFGHSQGGLIATMLAAKNPTIAFVILLAAPGLRGDSLLILQQKMNFQSQGMSDSEWKNLQNIQQQAFTMVKNATDKQQLKNDLKNFYLQHFEQLPSIFTEEMEKDDFVKLAVNQLLSMDIYNLLRSQPDIYLQKIQCPVLALNGQKDKQVAAKENLEAIKNAMQKADNQNVTIKMLPNLNHFFQDCQSGDVLEYALIEQTMSGVVLQELFNWLTKNVIQK